MKLFLRVVMHTVLTIVTGGFWLLILLIRHLIKK